MRNPLTSPLSTSFGIFLVRVPIGALFIMAGFMKFRMEGGLSGFVNMALPMSKNYMPEALGKTYLYMLPFVELLVGVMILLGLFTRFAALIAALIMISIMMAVTGVKMPDGSYHSNLFIFIMTLMLVFTGSGQLSLDSVIGKSSKPTPPAAG